MNKRSILPVGGSIMDAHNAARKNMPSIQTKSQQVTKTINNQSNPVSVPSVSSSSSPGLTVNGVGADRQPVGWDSVVSGLKYLATVLLKWGGTGSDLSATGPGVLQQATTGANVTVGNVSASMLPVVSTSAKGACPQLPNTDYTFLNGQGSYTIPGFIPSVNSTPVSTPEVVTGGAAICYQPGTPGTLWIYNTITAAWEAH